MINFLGFPNVIKRYDGENFCLILKSSSPVNTARICLYVISILNNSSVLMYLGSCYPK